MVWGGERRIEGGMAEGERSGGEDTEKDSIRSEISS